MRQRNTLLALLATAAVGLTGCVSVSPPPGAGPRAPRPVPVGHGSDLPMEPPGRTTPAPAPPRTTDPGVAPDRTAAAAGTVHHQPPPREPGRPTVDVPHIADDLPARVTPEAPRPRPQPRPEPTTSPSTTYDMRFLCDASAGIAAPAVTSACRGAYR
ncbi:hypothetical protein [Streptomyces yaizuensis]|uniref:Lipoprotein n=1 Tax=Streptomyces yaizuensis TaxID=2989713 RepID=A0ABQ5NSL4_9ACTN|nr:hypothetical protein [Streptomyces sp. YSPA8]GLF93357.1 hypothetical protein SYYSPA8_03690 [Streptomyces sp. YSPA8]